MTADQLSGDVSADIAGQLPPATLARIAEILAGTKTFDSAEHYMTSVDEFGPFEAEDYGVDQ